MSTPTATTNITPVGVDKILSLKENNIKKRKFMDNRFPKLKGLVYRRMQFLSFKDKLRWFFTAVKQARHISKREAISITKDMYTYLYNTRDIWTSIDDRFCTTTKKKMLELYEQEPTDFKSYLLQFGYICPYPKRNQEICSKQVNGTLCKTHSICQDRLCSRISLSLPCLPTDLSNIIFKYSLPY